MAWIPGVLCCISSVLGAKKGLLCPSMPKVPIVGGLGQDQYFQKEACHHQVMPVTTRSFPRPCFKGTGFYGQPHRASVSQNL